MRWEGSIAYSTGEQISEKIEAHQSLALGGGGLEQGAAAWGCRGAVDGGACDDAGRAMVVKPPRLLEYVLHATDDLLLTPLTLIILYIVVV